MRVAVLTTSYPASAGDPAGHFVRSEARALVDAGEQVTVFAPRERGSRPKQLPGDPRVHWLEAGEAFGLPGAIERLSEHPLRAASAVRFLWQARRELGRRRQFDRVIAHWLVPMGWPLGVSLGLPIEVVIHGSDIGLLERMPHALAARIVRTILKRGGSFRFVSLDLMQRLERLSGIDLAATSCVRPAALDLGSAPSRQDARAALGVDSRETLIVLVGRLIQSKRCDVALSAISLIPDARVVVVGDGPDRAVLAQRFPRAEFRGNVPRPVALSWIAAADVLVSASLDEGAPTAVREARALGVEVVAAAAGDLEAWARSDTGLHVLRVGARPRPSGRTAQATRRSAASDR